MTTALEQSLAEDIAAEQSALKPKEVEKEAEIIADEVVEQVNEIDKPEQEIETPDDKPKPVNDDDDEPLPENPTKDDFAKQRRKEKALREELRKEREDKARQAGYIAAKNEAPPVAKQEPVDPAITDPEPDIELNPRDWKAWNQRQVDARFDTMQQNFQQAQVTSSLKETISLAKQEEATYAKDNPVYTEAKAYLDEKAFNILKNSNPLADEAAIKAKLVQDEYSAILKAKELGLHPAIWFEMLAKQSGFQSKAAGNGIVPPAEKKPNMEAIKRNKEKSPSLVGSRSNASGMGEPTDEEIVDLTLSQLAAMKG